MSVGDAHAEHDLYEFAASLEPDDLDDAAISACEAAILDHFACALIGMELPWTRTLRSVLAADPSFACPAHLQVAGQPASARIYGAPELVSPFVAALVNGTATHGIDLDDLYFPAMSHPGCVINPASFALAPALGCSGPELLTAVAAGYEVMCRLGQATGMTGGDRGLHATGQQGPVGAAVAATKLFGGDACQIESAVGLAVSFGGGIKAFQAGPGMVKRLHAGRAASSGLFAAQLARHGFDGPHMPLSSTFGFINVFAMSGRTDFGALSCGLGDHFAVQDIYFKPYPACGALHGSLAAIEQLVSAHPIDPARVARIDVGTSKRAASQNSIPQPIDVLSAQYSMEYSVALGLLGQARDGRRFLVVNTDEDAVARDLAQRVFVHVDDRAEAAFPLSNEADVHVRLDDGTLLQQYGQCNEHTSRGWDVAAAKFGLLMRDVLTQGSTEDLAKAVRALRSGGRPLDCLDAISLTNANAT